MESLWKRLAFFTSSVSSHSWTLLLFFFFVAKFKCNFYQAVKGETSGHFKHALLAILQCSENPAMYFAKVLISFQVLTSFSTCKILNSFLFNSTSTLDMKKLNVQFKINFAGAAQGNERSGNWWYHADKGNCDKNWDWYAIYKSWIPQEIQEDIEWCSSFWNIRPLSGFPSFPFRAQSIAKIWFLYEEIIHWTIVLL